MIGTAKADEIVLHLGSQHTKSGFNNVNPGIGYKFDSGFGLGVYRNSYHRTTAYISKELMYTKNFGAVLGLGTGYKLESEYSITLIGGAILKLDLTRTSKLNVLVLPPLGRGTAGFVHAAISFKI